MNPRTRYKVDKYVSKLQNAKNPEEANMYQAKLRFYHRKNQIGSGPGTPPEEQTQKEASISELLSALKDRIERCDKALEKLESMNSRMSSIENSLIQSNIKPEQEEKSVEGNLTDKNQELLDRIVSLEKEVRDLKGSMASYNYLNKTN